MRSESMVLQPVRSMEHINRHDKAADGFSRRERFVLLLPLLRIFKFFGSKIKPPDTRLQGFPEAWYQAFRFFRF